MLVRGEDGIYRGEIVKPATGELLKIAGPSVTTVIGPYLADFSAVPPEVLARAARRGTDVHNLIHQHETGSLDFDAIHPDNVQDATACLQAWIEFKAANDFKVLASELQVVSQRYRYVGTLDVLGILRGRPAVIDFKTRQARPKYDGPQTAAYAWAMSEFYFPGAPFLDGITARQMTGKTRYTLELKEDGTYKLTEWNDERDFNVFLSALALYNWTR